MSWIFDEDQRDQLIADLQSGSNQYRAADACIDGDSLQDEERRDANRESREQISDMVRRLTQGRGFVDRSDPRWVSFRSCTENLRNATHPCQDKPIVFARCEELDDATDVADLRLVEH